MVVWLHYQGNSVWSGSCIGKISLCPSNNADWWPDSVTVPKNWNSWGIFAILLSISKFVNAVTAYELRRTYDPAWHELSARWSVAGYRLVDRCSISVEDRQLFQHPQGHFCNSPRKLLSRRYGGRSGKTSNHHLVLGIRAATCLLAVTNPWSGVYSNLSQSLNEDAGIVSLGYATAISQHSIQNCMNCSYSDSVATWPT